MPDPIGYPANPLPPKRREIGLPGAGPLPREVGALPGGTIGASPISAGLGGTNTTQPYPVGGVGTTPLNPVGAGGTSAPGGSGFSALSGAPQTQTQAPAPQTQTPPPQTPPPQTPPPQTGQSPTAPPQTPPQSQAPTAPMDPNAAMQQLMQQFKSKYGRDLTPQEQQQLIQRSGYTGGPVTPEMFANASTLLDQFVTPDQALQAQQRQSLMDLMQGKTPVTLDPNDPAIAAQRSSFDRTNSMVTGRQRLAAAERNAARGTLGAGGFDANLAGVENDAATRKSAFEGDLLSRERQGQIDRLMQSLGMTQQYGATQLQGQLGRGQLGLGLLNALLGDKQANNLLGFNYTSLQNQMNNQALQNILNYL